MVVENLRCSDRCALFCHKFGAETCCQYCPERVRELCRRFQLCRQGECLCCDMDTLLMAAFADGDELAFDALYRRNMEWARKLAFRLLGNWHDACDVVQDAFLRIFSNRNRWRPKAKFQTWFHRIVVNLSLKRRSVPMSVSTLSELTESEEASTDEGATLLVVESPEATLISAEQMEQLQFAIEKLPERQRQALSLWAQGFSYCQIAQHLNCSISAVETLLHRAKRNLRKQMGD